MDYINIIYIYKGLYKNIHINCHGVMDYSENWVYRSFEN